jgi:ATP synthase protein I
MKMAKVGAWAFILGVIIALFLGFLPDNFKGAGVSVLVLAGIIVGFLNVTDKETTPYLMAAVAIMIALFTAGQQIALSLQSLGVLGEYLKSLLANINMFVFPATVVVAMKAIYNISKDA